MIFLSLIFFPIVELMVFIKFVQAYSFLDAILFLFSSGLLGIFIMKLQGKATFAKLQAQALQGQIPDNQVLHSAFVLLGGLLIFIPGFISDILGFLCLLPGSRHLLIWYFKNSIKGALSKGQIKVFSQGSGFPPTGFGRMRDTQEERDAQVIDIEPTRITHINKKIDP